MTNERKRSAAAAAWHRLNCRINKAQPTTTPNRPITRRPQAEHDGPPVCTRQAQQ